MTKPLVEIQTNEQRQLQTRDCGAESNADELTGSGTAVLPLDHKPAEPCAECNRQHQLTYTPVTLNADKKPDKKL